MKLKNYQLPIGLCLMAMIPVVAKASVVLPASIGDYVWEDKNANGIQEDGEQGIADATVVLTDCSGTPIQWDYDGEPILPVETVADGAYHFVNLDPGHYRVVITLPSGYVFTQQVNVAGSASNDDSNVDPGTGISDCRELISGQNDPTVDAGAYRLASLGDLVWKDLDRDGVQDDDEPGFPDVTVNLYKCDGTFVATMQTGPDGEYLFTGLVPGEYYVEFIAPAGYAFSDADQTDDALDSDADTTTGVTICTTLESGEEDLTWDAGLYQLASIGDYVWLDADKDGIQDDDETGFAGVTVNLYRCGDPAVYVAYQVTDENGNYSFTDLEPGDYYVEFVAPDGYVISPQDQQGDDEKDSDADMISGKTICTTLEAGENDLSWDAGLHEPTPEPPAALGDYVWHDKNGDGVQGDDEPGVDGVVVYLYDCDGNYLDETLTADGGKYAFTDLPAGSYQVVFVLPDGYLFTKKDQGDEDAADSDADLTGTTTCVTLAPGETNNTIDAGLVLPGIQIKKYVKCVEDTPQCGEGRPPCHWKKSYNHCKWRTYKPTHKCGDVFGLKPWDKDCNVTLGEALNRCGGDKEALCRQGVAALLNSCDSDLDYAFSTSEVIEMVKKAYDCKDYEKTKDKLACENEKGCKRSYSYSYWWYCKPTCPPTPGFGDDADTEPGPTFAIGKKVQFTFVVTNTGGTPLANVVVTDDNETPDDESDDFSPTPTLDDDNVHNVGDDNQNGLLDSGEVWLYTSTKTVTPGQHTNVGTVVANPVDAGGNPTTDEVTSFDPANYTGPTVPGSLCGYVYFDCDNDGRKDWGEKGLDCVKLTLTGTVGSTTVTRTTTTDCNGAYKFDNLPTPGVYKITESQPTWYEDGKDSVGTLGGTVGNDVFSSINVGSGASGKDYNFGERAKSCSKPCVGYGMSGKTWFWGGRHGEDLIKSCNGSAYDKKLGYWLSGEFPNLFGCLKGKKNYEVASYCKQLCNSRDSKLKAEALCAALAVYCTDESKAGGKYACKYGFKTSSKGCTGDATWKLGSNGSRMGFYNYESYTVMELLNRADDKKAFSASSSTQDAFCDVFEQINRAGGID